MPTNTYQPDGTAGKDAYITSSFATSNYGTDTNLYIQTTSGKSPSYLYSLLEFDVSDIPAGATIDAAKFTFYCHTVNFGGGFTNGGVARLLRAWVESQVTFNDWKSGSAWTSPGALSDGNDYTSSGQVTWTAPTSAGSFDITGLASLVQDALDNRSGVLSVVVRRTSAPDSNGILCYSSDHGTASQRPKLTVDYTEAAGAKGNFFPFF